VGWPFGWDDNLWSAKRPRSLLQQLGVGVKSDLIEDEDLGRDKPDCETNHQRAQWEWFWRLDYFHGSRLVFKTATLAGVRYILAYLSRG